MKWSFSQHKTFKRCQRQWFYRNILACAIAKDATRHEASRLSKLTTVWAWRGKVVDAVLSDRVIPAIAAGHQVTVDSALAEARRMFEAQRLLGLQGASARSNGGATGSFGGFVEVEYRQPFPEGTFEKAWQDVEQSIRNCFEDAPLLDQMRAARRVVTQRNLSFNHDGASVIAVPDVICFYDNEPPLIVDWKVNTDPVRDFWLQLATYGIALTRCNPHRDWPPLPSGMTPCDVRLAEVQLLTQAVREHVVTEEDISQVSDLIYWSFQDMMLACGGQPSAKVLRADAFDTAVSPGPCKTCQFRKLCSGGQP
jgi:hypothetical protein